MVRGVDILFGPADFSLHLLCETYGFHKVEKGNSVADFSSTYCVKPAGFTKLTLVTGSPHIHYDASPQKE